ncbi:MAG: hypothetical protein ACLQVD_20925 [Capsulimonadaceae bacterium]
MTLNVSLTSVEEKRVRTAAESRGEDMDVFLNEILKKAIAEFADPEAESETGELILGMHAGQGWIADDFDAPLPDSFWLVEEPWAFAGYAHVFVARYCPGQFVHKSAIRIAATGRSALSERGKCLGDQGRRRTHQDVHSAICD